MPMTLIAGRDYPRSYREFAEWFHDDATCAKCLEALRWPNGFTCPACGIVDEPWRETRGRLVCRVCRHQTSVIAGTILEKTRTPLTIWFEAAWHVTTTKNGFSAKSLERTLGIRYRVAWTLLQRFRVAMVRAERQPLSGTVEVDETLVGGVEHHGKRGRGAKKSIVVIRLEIKEPKGYGRVRMRQVAAASDANLRGFVCETVAPGAIVQTDGWSGYNR
jgi:transposase-like protein